jgi:hypothetical protein
MSLNRLCRLALGLALFLLLTAVPQAARATEVGNTRTFGLGFAVGDPTGIVGKLFLGPGQALDFGLSFARYGGGRCWNGDQYVACNRTGYVGLNVDYLWQNNIIYDRVTLDWHIGAGGRIWFISDNDYEDDLALAARMPIGLDLMFANPSFLEVFVELAPSLYLLPGTDFGIEAALGVRFYF